MENFMPTYAFLITPKLLQLSVVQNDQQFGTYSKTTSSHLKCVSRPLLRLHAYRGPVSKHNSKQHGAQLSLVNCKMQIAKNCQAPLPHK
jgi:hypothetical protein